MEVGLSKILDLFQDESFTKEVSSEHTLCLEFDAELIKLGVFNSSNSALVCSAAFNQDSIADVPFINFDFGTVLGVYHPNKSFLAHKKLKEDQFDSLLISELNKGVFHSTAEEIPAIFKAKFPQIRLFPFGANFISGAFQKNRYQSGLKLYVHLTENMLYLLHFSDNKLMLYSTESLIEQKEAIYYISKAIELTNFNQLESKIYLSGDIGEESDIHHYLAERVKNLYLNKGFKFQKAALSLSGLEKQKFFSVINTYQCA